MCKFENKQPSNFNFTKNFSIRKTNFQIFKLADFQIVPWAEQGSNLRTRERTDLQSVAFNRSAICPLPFKIEYFQFNIWVT